MKKSNKKVNKNNVNNVYYARLTFYDGEEFLEQVKINLDYDLYNSFKKAPNGDYYLNDKNMKLIQKTLNRFVKQALESDNLHIEFQDSEDLGIGFHRCQCGCKYIMVGSFICTGLSFPEGQCFRLNLVFKDKEEC